MESLIDILENLISNFKDLNENTLKEYADQLNNIYSVDDFRHSYAEISIFLEKKTYPDQRENLVHRIDELLSYLDDNNYSADVVKKVGKLVDHLQLESVRLSRIDNIKFISEQIKIQQSSRLNELKENVKKAEKLQNELKNINTQLVSVLGIFTGIVISIFGGMSFFSSVFNNINDVGRHRLIFITTLVGFTLFNLTAFMFSALFILTGKSFSLFPKSSRFYSSKKLHSTIYIITNIIFITIMIAIFISWKYL